MITKKLVDKNDQIRDAISRELCIFERQAGELPCEKEKEKYKNIGAVWVVSGGGSYFSPIINSPSDRIYSKNSWYCGQDKARLDYAMSWVNAFTYLNPLTPPMIIYNGTKKQNDDLLKAIDEGIFKFPKSQLYIASGKITRTLDQVKNFSFPPAFEVKKTKLAVLSHSAHLPRLLRFMNKFPKPFRGVEIVPLSINLNKKADQRQMLRMELDNLLGYIERDETSAQAYPFEVRL